MGRKKRPESKRQVSLAVGKVLEKRRIALGWNRRLAAIYSGISGPQSVKHHETGVNTITVDFLAMYCAAYGVDAAEVLAEALSEQAWKADHGGSDDSSE